MVKNNETLLISVKDTGIGISVAELGKIYTKFFRAQRAVAQNPEGSGLGLYVVKSYVESWGGKVTVESVEGKGSTFTITLPIKVKDG
jgi:signal transduction histidine kinase